MKTKIIQNIKSVIVILLLVVGVSYVSANFTSPHSTPPTCITDPTNVNYDPGCLAPINIGSVGQTKTGPLTLGGLGIVGDFKFLPTGLTPPTTGQVLMADDTGLSLGKVKWGTVSGGGSGTLSQTCNVLETGIAETGYNSLSFIVGGNNICADSNGCSWRAWSYNEAYPEGRNLYGSNDYLLRQSSTTDKWLSSLGNYRGTNGDSTSSYVFSNWDGGGWLMDDSTAAGGETLDGAFTFRDSSTTYGYAVSVCNI